MTLGSASVKEKSNWDPNAKLRKTTNPGNELALQIERCVSKLHKR